MFKILHRTVEIRGNKQAYRQAWAKPAVRRYRTAELKTAVLVFPLIVLLSFFINFWEGLKCIQRKLILEEHANMDAMILTTFIQLQNLKAAFRLDFLLIMTVLDTPLKGECQTPL